MTGGNAELTNSGALEDRVHAYHRRMVQLASEACNFKLQQTPQVALRIVPGELIKMSIVAESKKQAVVSAQNFPEFPI